MSLQPARAIVCENIGIAGTTPVMVKELTQKERAMGLTHGDRLKPRFEMRVGIAVMGSTNMSKEERDEVGNDPFDVGWHDNYAAGFGDTEEEALEALKQEQSKLAESLHY